MTPMTEADIAVRDYRNAVADSFGMDPLDLDMRIRHHLMYVDRTGYISYPSDEYCSITTQRGMVCRQGASVKISPYFHACNRHADELSSALVEHIANDLPAGYLRDAARAFWQRLQRDDHSRAVVRRHLGELFDRAIDEALESKWGAA